MYASPATSVFSVLGFSVFPKDAFALVQMGRTALASLASGWMDSFLSYGDEGFWMTLLLPPRSGLQP